MKVVPASRLLADDRPLWLAEWTKFAALLRIEDVPAAVVDHARLVLLDTLGAIVAGMREPEMRAWVERGADAGPAAVIGAGRTVSQGAAALFNGSAGTFLELDEGNQFARGHPAIQVIPAALAAAASGASGARLLEAIILGYDLGARIGVASKLRVSMHPHGVWGSPAAALAVAKVAGASAEEMASAVNIGSSLGLATSRRTMLEGATVRNVYSGAANHLGLLAFDLARAGFTGESDGVASVFGEVAAEGFQASEMLDGLGARWEIARNYFKRHAACRYTHAALDALAAIAAEAGEALRPEAVQGIEVQTYVWAAQLDNPCPENMLAAKFSLPFALASALVHGRASPEAFRPDAIGNPVVRSLAARVRVSEDPALTDMLPGRRPARVTVTLNDGRRLEATAEVNKGDVEDPYSRDEVVTKFHELADQVWGRETALRIADLLLRASLVELGSLNGILASPARA